MACHKRGKHEQFSLSLESPLKLAGGLIRLTIWKGCNKTQFGNKRLRKIMLKAQIAKSSNSPSCKRRIRRIINNRYRERHIVDF